MAEEIAKQEKLQIDVEEAVKKIMEVTKHAEEETKEIEQETKEHP